MTLHRSLVGWGSDIPSQSTASWHLQLLDRINLPYRKHRGCCYGVEDQWRHHAMFHADRSNCFRDMAIFRFFKMAVVRHLGFVKVENFNFRSSSEAQCASPCQISCRSNRCGDMADFRYFNLDLIYACSRPLTKSVWWSPWLCKIWLELVQQFR